MVQVCAGCGAVLQSENSAAAGFVPSRLMQENRNLCRRCHRQKLHATGVGPEESLLSLRKGLEHVDMALLVVDITDFEGTFSRRLAECCGRRVFVVANKVDLLPSKTPHREVLAWLEKRLADARVAHQGTFLISAVKGVGTRALWDAVKKAMGGRGTLAVIGVAGVGKTALLQTWQEAGCQEAAKRRRARRKAKKAPAEVEPVAVDAVAGADKLSCAPMPIADSEGAENGAAAVSPPRPRRRRTAQKAQKTQKAAEGSQASRGKRSRRRKPERSKAEAPVAAAAEAPVAAAALPASDGAAPVERVDIKVVELAGLAGRGRFADILCPACGGMLVPKRALRSKALRLKEGQAVILGGLAALAVLATGGEQTGLVLAFLPADVPVKRTTVATIDAFLQGNTDKWAFAVCQACQETLLGNGWEEAQMIVGPAEDLALHGLGWFSVRKSPVTLRVLLPAGIHASVRPRLVGPKD